MSPRPDRLPQSSQLCPAHTIRPRVAHGQLRGSARKPLRVLKFGGTSVADASCIEKVVDIVQTTARTSDVVVVVSAMSDVTNKLLEAATQSGAGNRRLVVTVFDQLRNRHETAVNALIGSAVRRRHVLAKVQELFQEGQRLCEEVVSRHELTLRARDAISALGERLSATLVAAALVERGVDSEAVEATELVVTDCNHGAAEPLMDLTFERCETRLRPLLLQGIVAVVTGFIGATREGVPTTLGRNSSDYSGTIIGAALNADEVTLWTDVDGILTADPKLVPGARPILEMSYREASDLACSGAKVLHSKTLHPVMQRGIPLAIRNTFAPDRPGTKITPSGPSDAAELRALIASTDISLITVRGSNLVGTPEILCRALAVARAELQLILQPLSSPDEVCFVVSSGRAEHAFETLRHEFAEDLGPERVRHVTLNSTVAIITVVGCDMRGVSGRAERLSRALGRRNLSILASAPSASASSLCFVVAREHMQAALVAVHDELHRQPVPRARSLQEQSAKRS